MGFSQEVAEYKHIMGKAERLRNHIDLLEQERDKITNDITKERVQSSRVGDKVQQLAVEIADAKAELSEVICCQVDIAKSIWRYIDKVPDHECAMVLEDNIIRGKSITEIAADMNYSDMTIYRRKQKAIAFIKSVGEC